jgi:glycosyltransferase involved in cell wall biosynthesis
MTAAAELVRDKPAPALAGSAAERPEDSLHVLAQLPEEFELELSCDPGSRGRLELIAAAYGIEDRVSLASGWAGGHRWKRGGRSLEPTAGAASLAEIIHCLSAPEPLAPARPQSKVLAGHRVALVTNLPVPYRVSLFNGLSARLDGAGADLRVLFLASAARGRTWLRPPCSLEFEHEFLHSVCAPLRRRPPFVPLNLGRRLKRFAPTIVVAAGFSPFVSGRAASFATTHRLPFGLYSGETPAMGAASPSWRARLRARLARRADFAIAYGSLGQRYLQALNPRLPVILGRNTSVARATGDAGSGSGTVELLTVGDLGSRRKGVDVLVDALRLVPELPCRLSIVGEGREREGLQQRGAGDRRIRFLGALSGHRLQRAYAQSDVFLFPSRADVFGLALVEAMAAGLPCAVSPAPGAVADVAVRGQNCLVVDSHRPEVWAQAIERLTKDEGLRRSIGDAAWKTVAMRWTLGHAVEAMTAGIRLGALIGARA